MFGASWLSRRCVNILIKPASRQILRFQSNGASPSSTISPALLNRARSLAQEHARLTEKTSDTFDAKVAKRLGELQSTAETLAQWEQAQSSLEELNTLLDDPDTDPELRELAAEDITATAEHLQSVSKALEVSLTPKHPFADLPCLLEIRPGAGGGEANLFAGDLLRMYRAYCNNKGFRTSLIKYEDEAGSGDAGSAGPLQEAILEIEDAGAYDALRSEAGVHRVQRVPATESKGRTHTSAVSVLVLPSFPTNANDSGGAEALDFDNPESDYYVNPQDVRTDVMRARGAGGQHVNTTDSAVRLTHIPTNTVVSMQDSRSQHKNREKAWNVLRARLAQARREAREEEMMQLRRSVVGVARMGRGDKIRTYNWGQQRVTDHRSGLSVHNLGDVMAGEEELGKVIESVRVWMAEREIENLILEEEEKDKGKGKKA